MNKNIYIWILIVFLILFASSQIILKSNLTLGWDEGRHANSAHIWYDYYKTLLSGDFKSYKTFLNEYEQKGYNVKWYGLFDPPFQGMYTGLWFLILGDSVVIARLSILILVCALSFLLYFLANKILKEEKLALAVTVLYLLSSPMWEYSNEVILEPIISLFFVGWIYFTFYREKGSWDILLGGLCLTAASLMKYHTLIFAVGFIIVLLIYWTIKKEYQTIKKYFMVYALQGVLYVAFAGWWMYYSLIQNNVWQRMLEEGAGRAREWTFTYLTFYFRDTWPATWGLVLFVFVPLFFKEGREFLKKNLRLVLCILIIYIIATALISNQQLRYAIHLLPLLYIIIIKGIDLYGKWIDNIEVIKMKISFWILFILIIIMCSVFDYKDTINRKVNMNGYQDYELLDYMKKVPEPKLLVNLKTPADIDTTGYYYNPDQFIFLTMMANKESNPILMKQYSYYIDLKGIEDPKPVINSIEEFPANKAIVIFKYERVGYEGMIAKIEPILQELNYTKKELKWWFVYQKN